MSKTIQRVLSTLLCAALLFGAVPLTAVHAEDNPTSGACGDNLTWEYDAATATLTISGTGEMNDYYSNAPAPWQQYGYILEVVIIGNSVTSIGSGAFSDCTELVSITIPNSVTSIGSFAFASCESLTSVTIPRSVTIINDYAFAYCEGLINVDIPDAVTDIGNSVFSGCTALSDITIGNGITRIGANIFNNTAFYNNSDNWQNQVLYIDDCLIKAKTDLTGAYEIKPNTICIARAAFQNCSSLLSVTIPNSVVSIDQDTFNHCTSLVSVDIPNSIMNIDEYAFYGCTNLSNVIIPDNAINIGDYSFYECESLTSIIIPKNVMTIGGCSFERCTNLTSVVITNGVESIGGSAFAYCTGLTSVTIPNSATSIGDCAFNDCTNLASISIIGNNISYIGMNAFRGTAYYSNNANWNNDILYIGHYLVGTKTSLSEEYEVLPNTKCIACLAFEDCTNLTELSIPNSVTSIGAGAFSSCSNLARVTLSDSIQSIEDSTFFYCKSLKCIDIPDSVVRIGKSAFYGCTSLTDVIIPNSVISIGDGAFNGCTGLTSINLPNSITNIGAQAFYGCTRLTSITIPTSVTSIGSWTFYYCIGLTNVTIPDSVTSIEAQAFSGCAGLKSITIPDSVTSIENWAFNYCSSLLYAHIPSSVTSIGDDIFYGCNSLSYICSDTSNCYVKAYAEENGIVFRVCNGCTHEYTSVVTTQPTCTEEGVLTFTCSLCGDSFTASIPALGHNYEAVTTKEPTCLEEGVRTYTCSRCGDSYTEPIPKTAHTDANGDGICDVCGEDASDILPGETKTVEITGGEITYLCFIPKLSGSYTFTSSASGDTYGYLCDADKNEIESNDDGGSGSNFKITCNLIKGRTYYFGCRFYSSSQSGSFPVTLTLDAALETLTATSGKDVVIDTMNGSIYGLEPNVTDLSAYFTAKSGYTFTCSDMARDNVYSTGTTVSVYSGGTLVAAYTLVLFGDIDGDGWYDGTDAYFVGLVANGLISQSVLTEAQRAAADCNHDGTVDNADVALLEQAGLLLANVDQTLPSEELQTDSVYLEYCSLIDQTVEIIEPEQPAAEQPAQTAEQPAVQSVWGWIKALFTIVLNWLLRVF